MKNELSVYAVSHTLILPTSLPFTSSKTTALYENKITITDKEDFFGVPYKKTEKNFPISLVEGVEYINHQAIKINFKQNDNAQLEVGVFSYSPAELSGFI